MRIFVYLLLLILFSCHPHETDGNDYLQNLNTKLRASVEYKDKIRAMSNMELEKYNATHDKLYLISSKYAELFLYTSNEERLKQIPMFYELLKLNNDDYEYITVACNSGVAWQFKTSSASLAMQLFNIAIAIDEKTGKRFFLPHLYYGKGSLYYDKKDYKQAMFYFKKALDLYGKTKIDETLYIASMHNNFAMCYEKLDKLQLAIEEAQKAISILENKTIALNDEEKFFLIFCKRNLGVYLIKNKDYSGAEKLLRQVFEYCKDKKQDYPEAITALKNLLEVYMITNQKNNQKETISLLKEMEPKLSFLIYRITANEAIQKYYAFTNDLQNLKIVCDKLKKLNNQYVDISKKEFNQLSNLTNNYVTASIKQKYDHKIKDKERRNIFVITLIILVIIVLLLIIFSIHSNHKKGKKIAEQQKIITDKDAQAMEEKLKTTDEKLKNMYLSLSLKLKTEKVFLDDLKNVKKLKSIDIDQTLNDLILKMTNLIQVDKKNIELFNESSDENRIFIEKISYKFPFLTPQEIKLSIYFKLNLSSKEIALLEDISDGSVRVYKTKIKYKLGLNREDNLVLFLNTVFD